MEYHNSIPWLGILCFHFQMLNLGDNPKFSLIMLYLFECNILHQLNEFYSTFFMYWEWKIHLVIDIGRRIIKVVELQNLLPNLQDLLQLKSRIKLYLPHVQWLSYFHMTSMRWQYQKNVHEHMTWIKENRHLSSYPIKLEVWTNKDINWKYESCNPIIFSIIQTTLNIQINQLNSTNPIVVKWF